VAVRGRYFRKGDKVYLGQQQLPVQSYGNGSLIVTIPDNARSNYFQVESDRGVRVRSRGRFRVVDPAPVITGLNPPQGQPGTVVRVLGQHLGSDVSVYYGRQAMPIRRQGPGWLEVVIPANSNRSWPISIRSRRGKAVSKQSFGLELPPVLSSFSPAYGSVGSRVLLRGDNFRAHDRVSLAGQDLPIIQLQDRQITVEIPPGARSGAFALHRNGASIQTASTFDVVYAPVINDLSTHEGEIGTRVVLTGDHLDGCRIYFGRRELRPRRVQARQIEFEVPPWARNARVRVVSRGGEAVTGYEFNVWEMPKILRVSSSRGGYGSTLTISGNHLDKATNYYLGDREMRIVRRVRDKEVVVEVPRGAPSGVISWKAYGERRTTRHHFDILQPPTLQGYAPTEGAPGSRVVLRGTGFGRSSRVRYGKRELRVLRWTPTTLEVELPRNASTSDYFWVEDEGGGARSSHPFGIILPPSIASCSPGVAKPGNQVVLRGDLLTADTDVYFGSARAKVRAVQRDGSLLVQLPELAPGRYDLSVQRRGLKSTWRRPFIVDSWASVKRFHPKKARPGDTIMLSGQGLVGTRFFFGQWELAVVRSDRRGRRAWVKIPDGAAGQSPVVVDDQGHRTPSSELLQIKAPRPPKVRDHRRRKGPKVRDHRKRSY
jgi:hypothetical protein